MTTGDLTILKFSDGKILKSIVLNGLLDKIHLSLVPFKAKNFQKIEKAGLLEEAHSCTVNNCSLNAGMFLKNLKIVPLNNHVITVATQRTHFSYKPAEEKGDW